MKRLLLITVFIYAFVVALFSQSDKAQSELLKKHIEFLASDDLKGRRPGTEGDSLSEKYIYEIFRQNSALQGTFAGFQSFDVVVKIDTGSGNFVSFNSNTYKPGVDFYPLSFSLNTNLRSPVAFAGYGIELNTDSIHWNDYDSIDVKGKWVMVLHGDPEPDNDHSDFIAVSRDRLKAVTARDKGAVGLIFVHGKKTSPNDLLEAIHFDKSVQNAGMPVVQISRRLADSLLAGQGLSVVEMENRMIAGRHSVSSDFPSLICEANINLILEEQKTANVIGVVQGTDPVLKNEYVVIGAHFDHLGLGGEDSGSRMPDTLAVHNGADDNASGVAAVLELSRLFSKQPGKRTLIFIAYSGEEMGLLGSKYFVENPLVPLTSIKAVFNLDMVGRLRDDKKLSIGGSGTSLESDSLIKLHSAGYPFLLALSPDGYGPSDHASFYKKNIPVFFITTGAHEDYHTPFDDADKINFDAEAVIVDYTRELADDIANMQTPLTFKESGNFEQRPSRGLKVRLGIIPDVSAQDSKGLRVDGVRKGGPADKGGIQKGDLIVGIDGKSVSNIYEYMARLNKLKPGQRVDVEIIRNEKKEVLLIQL